MDNDERFEEIYTRIVEDNKEYIEASRKDAKKEDTIDNGIFGTIALICFVLFMVVNNKIVDIICILVGALIGIYILRKAKKGKSKIQKYDIDYRERIIGDLIKYIDNKLYYSTEKNIDKDIYDSGEFEKYEYYESQDLISGDLNNVHLEMSKIHTWDEVKKDNNYKVLNVFYGLFTKIDFQSDFEDTIIIRKKGKDLYKKLLNAIERYDLKDMRVNIENEKFNNYFEIYSGNEEYTNKVLNKDIQEKLVSLYEEMDAMNTPFDITLKQKNAYIRLFDGKIFNAPFLKNNSLEKEVIYRYYKILKKNMDIINIICSI